MKFTIDTMGGMAVMLAEKSDERSAEAIRQDAAHDFRLYAAHANRTEEATTEGLTFEEWQQLKVEFYAFLRGAA